MAKTPSKKSAKAPKKAAGGKKKKTRVESYSTYIYRVLKQVHPDTGISKKGMSIMNSFINDIFERIALEASKLCRFSKKATLAPGDPDRVRLMLPASSPSTPSRGHQGRHQVLVLSANSATATVAPPRGSDAVASVTTTTTPVFSNTTLSTEDFATARRVRDGPGMLVLANSPLPPFSIRRAP
ncbi:hypothetical protein JL722_10188 [Aureococcus anophagefferens]|nr:hypothetical protein JL722_10188 [Aureococcus anophagefferens]